MNLHIGLTGGTSAERLLVTLFLKQSLERVGLRADCACFDANPDLLEELDFMLERRLPTRLRSRLILEPGVSRPRPPSKKKESSHGRKPVKGGKR